MPRPRDLTQSGSTVCAVAFRELSSEQLREAVQVKNHMWLSRYRTVDQYNIFGQRSTIAAARRLSAEGSISFGAGGGDDEYV